MILMRATDPRDLVQQINDVVRDAVRLLGLGSSANTEERAAFEVRKTEVLEGIVIEPEAPYVGFESGPGDR